MNALKQFIIKEFYHITRDKRTLLILFGIPIAQLLIFGYAIRTEITNIELGVLDYSKDYMTKEITNKILSSEYFEIRAYLNSEKDIEKYFQAGKIKQVIIFEPDFAQKLLKEGKANIQIINDASNPNVATQINTYITGIISNYQQDLIKTTLKSGLLIIPEVKMLYNPELKSVFMFVPGLIAFLLLLTCTLMTSIAITREKEFGNMEVLLVSPLKPPVIVIGKVLPYISLALINGSSILLIAYYVFNVPVKGSIYLLLMEIFIYLLTSLSLGIFISTIAKQMQIAMVISIVGLMMPTMLLSGFIYPIENMPGWLQIITNIIPATWFLIIIKGIMLKGVGLEFFYKETLILLGMTILFILLSIKKFKIRLE
jgi:ABC-2 type transport system permease protein